MGGTGAALGVTWGLLESTSGNMGVLELTGGNMGSTGGYWG